MSTTPQSSLRPFSSGYYLAELRVIEYSGDKAVMPHDLWLEYREFVDEVNIKVGNTHWNVVPQGSVPSDTLALPSYEDKDAVQEVLVVKDRAFDFDTRL